MGSISVWSGEDETPAQRCGRFFDLPVTAGASISILNVEGVSEKPLSLLLLVDPEVWGLGYARSRSRVRV